MTDDVIDTEGEAVQPSFIARHDDSPALRELVARCYKHLRHIGPCAAGGAAAGTACMCGLEKILFDAVRLGCRHPVQVRGPAEPGPSGAPGPLEAVVLIGGFLGGLIGSIAQGAQAPKADAASKPGAAGRAKKGRNNRER